MSAPHQEEKLGKGNGFYNEKARFSPRNCDCGERMFRRFGAAINDRWSLQWPYLYCGTWART